MLGLSFVSSLNRIGQKIRIPLLTIILLKAYIRATSSFSSHPSWRVTWASNTAEKRRLVAAASMMMQFSTNNNSNLEALRRPLIISGPSGVGKGTLIRRLLAEFPTKFGFSCSHTTRGPRPGEEEGIDYYYTNKETILADIAAGKFLEHATVHGNLYGTSFDAIRRVQDEGKICILDIDVQGVVSVKESAGRGKIRDLRPLYIFIAPPSLETLEARLRGRETEKEEDVIRRLGNARKEVEYGLSLGTFDKVVVNGDLEEAYLDLKTYIDDMYFGRRKRGGGVQEEKC